MELKTFTEWLKDIEFHKDLPYISNVGYKNLPGSFWLKPVDPDILAFQENIRKMTHYYTNKQ